MAISTVESGRTPLLLSDKQKDASNIGEVPPPGASTQCLWFMDVAAAGGWTARGTAKVLAERLQFLSAAERPMWMSQFPPDRMEEVLTKVIIDAVDVSHVIQEHMDSERLRGRDFEEIYGEVKPFIERASRPLEQDIVQGEYVGCGCFSDFLDMRRHVVEQDTLPHKNLASWTHDEYFEYANKMREASQQAASLTKAKETVDARQQAKQARATLDEQETAKAKPEGDAEERAASEPQATSSSQAASSSKAKPSTAVPTGEGLPPRDVVIEPMALVGSCNGWCAEVSTDVAGKWAFAVCDSEKLESSLTVKVPAGGLHFQILSVLQFWEWRLYPSAKGTLKFGEDNAVQARLARGISDENRAARRDFRIKGAGFETTVVVHVAMFPDQEGACIWLAEHAGEGTEPGTEPAGEGTEPGASAGEGTEPGLE